MNFVDESVLPPPAPPLKQGEGGRVISVKVTDEESAVIEEMARLRPEGSRRPGLLIRDFVVDWLVSTGHYSPR